MLSYVLQRLALSLLICAVAMTVMFSLAYVIPGDPASIALGPRATPEMRAELHEKMGLDQPLPVQLGRFFGNVLMGDLGVDVFSHRSVTTIVFEALPDTLVLAGVGLGWAVLWAIPLGCYSAVRRNSWADRLMGIISVGTISIPSFLVAIYSVLLFAVALNWFPAIGAGEAGDPVDQAWHLVLPAFAIGLGWVGYLARLVRASMLDVLNEGHIRTARAFGLPEHVVIFRYALRIAVLPTVTMLGIGLGGLLSSCVFAEVVFSRPGLGQLALGAATSRNYPVLMGCTLVSVFLFTLFTLVSDVIVGILDPRIRSAL